MNQALATYMVCGDCVPATPPTRRTPSVEWRQLDDYRGRCANCGEIDGNLKEVRVLAAHLLTGWVTKTGKQINL